jgi:hypothetical protein
MPTGSLTNAGICSREIGIATSYSIFDLEISADYPPFLFENRFENVTRHATWIILENPDTSRTALSARAADVGEHRKTENELPPPHADPWPPMRQCYHAAKKPDRAHVRIGSDCFSWGAAKRSSASPIASGRGDVCPAKTGSNFDVGLNLQLLGGGLSRRRSEPAGL